jgi:carbonic anhydrase
MAVLAARGASPWRLDVRYEDSIQPAGRLRAIGSPEHTLELLRRGNGRWLEGGRRARPSGLAPQGSRCHAVVVACSDQRPAPEVVFDVRFGELVVVQTPSPSIDESVAASVLLGVHGTEASLVIALAHEECGVVERCGGELPTTALARMTTRALAHACDPDPAVARALAQAAHLEDLVGPHAEVRAAVLRRTGRVELLTR